MTKTREAFRIVFMGTPVFAVRTLEVLHSAGYQIAAVVTTPDKPAGRGLKLRPSAVKSYALSNVLPLLQPESLKNPDFIKLLEDYHADLFVVVAFRILPESVWKLPAHGTVNVHASLLPHYRGAAPINWTIINGESITGVTTFLIDREIDTGKMLLREVVPIGINETAGELHDRLMEAGAILMLRTADAIRQNSVEPIDQRLLVQGGELLKRAPKIFKDHCRINWNLSTIQVFNLIRGLSPYPAAFTILQLPDGSSHSLKVFRAMPAEKIANFLPGSIQVKDQKKMYISTSDGSLELFEIQLEGKSRMSVTDFLNGFRNATEWKAI